MTIRFEHAGHDRADIDALRDGIDGILDPAGAASYQPPLDRLRAWGGHTLGA